jgi:hypothetical protein
LDKFNFVSSESSQVRDIENTVISLGMFTVDTTDLHVIFVGDFLMELGVFHELREIDMYGCSQTGSHVGGASRNVTKMLVVGEFSFFFDLVGSGSKSSENLTNILNQLV